jgi:hypothetical protein
MIAGRAKASPAVQTIGLRNDESHSRPPLMHCPAGDLRRNPAEMGISEQFRAIASRPRGGSHTFCLTPQAQPHMAHATEQLRLRLDREQGLLSELNSFETEKWITASSRELLVP